ncbi:hypothetical protein GCM10022415_15890 [Knoellia locipacati]|uniref:Uncharacterized protein n=1 Tax=Knoellia locipacati TaxID=882824 RepID=A0A512T030_9MICO|nr:hypothetical protein [Knoellia locipacati]GEQ13539.1 hypothetical protein KLO01_15860 [Knoellia locipacati]
MEWSERSRERLEVALTEADVVGVRQVGDDSLEFLMHVSALPEAGPIDPDARRLLMLRGVAEAQFLLRRVTVEGNGPAIPIGSLSALDEFFETLAFGGSLYGWRYFDDPELTADWPDEPSLIARFSEHDAPHSFYWFNECARLEEGEVRSYCIEGTATFEDLTVLRADGSEQSADDFADEGVRWWQAFQDFENRVSTESQKAWGASRLTWREWPGSPAPSS